MKLNSGVPGTSLGLSFWRDLLYMAVRLPKRVWEYVLHWFLYQRECLVDDMGSGPCYLRDICYDTFYVTMLGHQYKTYRHGSTGGNHVTEGKIAGPKAKRSAVFYRVKYHHICSVEEPCY